MVALPDSAPDEVRRRLLGESFRLKPTNAAPLRMIDGVLFSADGKTLLAYPRGKTGEYVVPDGVEKIAERAFYECKALQAITLPDGLQTIESQAFYQCRSLEKVIFGDGLQTIESQAFYQCKSLRAVIFPDGLQTIDASAFDQCNQLWSFALPDGIRFYNLAGLLRRLSETRSIASPDSAPDDASSPRRDESLRPKPTPSPRLRLDGVLFSADGKTLLHCPRDKTGEYVVPDGVEHIADYAFYKCEALLAVTLPEGLRTIGQKAFEGCQALRAVALPDCAPDEVRRWLLEKSFYLTPRNAARFPVAKRCKRSRFPKDCKSSVTARSAISNTTTFLKRSTVSRFTARPVPSRKNTLAPTGSVSKRDKETRRLTDGATGKDATVAKSAR